MKRQLSNNAFVALHAMVNNVQKFKKNMRGGCVVGSSCVSSAHKSKNAILVRTLTCTDY